MAEKLFYTMGEVAEMFDVNTSLIRHWESQFPLLRPKRNKKGNRLFTPQDVEHLKMIYHLVKECGMTLEGAKKALRKGGAASSVERDAELMERLQRIRALLVEVREDLKSDEGVVDDGEVFPSEAARAEAGRETCGMRSMFDPEPEAFSAAEAVAVSEAMPEVEAGPEAVADAGESGESGAPAASVAKAESECEPERESVVFESESEPEEEVFESEPVEKTAPEFEAAMAANPDAAFDSASELNRTSEEDFGGGENESASAVAFDAEPESVAASGVASGLEVGSVDPDETGAEETDASKETGETDVNRESGEAEEAEETDETGGVGEAEDVDETGKAEVAERTGDVDETDETGKSEDAGKLADLEDTGDFEETGEVGEADESNESNEAEESDEAGELDEPDFVEIDLLTLRAERAEQAAKAGRVGEETADESTGSAGEAVETTVDGLSEGVEMGKKMTAADDKKMTAADGMDAANAPEEVEDREDDDRDDSDDGDHRNDSGDQGGEAGGADDDEPDFVLLDARTLEAVDPEENDFTAQAGRNEWAAGEVSETAPGQPVGRTGRRPRRRKEEVEDKELFAFYEQSLF